MVVALVMEVMVVMVVMVLALLMLVMVLMGVGDVVDGGDGGDGEGLGIITRDLRIDVVSSMLLFSSHPFGIIPCNTETHPLI